MDGVDAYVLAGTVGVEGTVEEKTRRRRRFDRPGSDSSHQDEEGREARLLPRSDLLGAASSGGNATAGAATPRRPPERERGGEGASGEKRVRGERER